jgi:hypothetical protein
VESPFETDAVSELAALLPLGGASSMSIEVARRLRWEAVERGFAARGLDWPLLRRAAAAGVSTSIVSLVVSSMSECGRFAGDEERRGGRAVAFVWRGKLSDSSTMFRSPPSSDRFA